MTLLLKHYACTCLALLALTGLVRGFGAGYVAIKDKLQNLYKHGTIELVLHTTSPQYFTEERRKLVYFGNWLRDYSQVMTTHVPKIGGSETLTEKFILKVLQHKAEKEFGKNKAFAVTLQTLGKEESAEHVDNPHKYNEKKESDVNLIDPKTGLKNYLVQTGQSYHTSMDYIQTQLFETLSLLKENEPVALRHFGQALHTIEDFYAHSNFLEMSLRALGYSKVFSFVGKDATIQLGKTITYPVVTGCVGSTLVNLLGLLKDYMIEKSPESAFKDNKHDQIVSNCIKSATCRLKTGLNSVKTNMLQVFLQKLQKLIAARTLRDDEIFKDPKSTNPTHAQLAKDHLDHPLNTIAGECASMAVQEMGQLLSQYAQSPKAIPAEDYVKKMMIAVKSLFMHPEILKNQVENNIGKRILSRIKAWSQQPGISGRFDRLTETVVRKGDISLLPDIML
jgi:hypothetical protein